MIDLDRSYVNRLLYFYFVASCKNITHAAREAGLHQSAMSRQMIKFEKEIGVILIKRHKSGITLTRKGEELFERAQKIFSEVQVSRRQLDEKEDISGKIRICSTHAIANYILAKPLIEFKKKNPNIYIELIGSDEVIDIVKNDVDIIIRPYDSQNSNIIQEPLFELQARLYASPEYVREYGYPQTAGDLKNHKFISRSKVNSLPFDSSLINWFLDIEDSTSQINNILGSNLVEAQYIAAENGLGIISGYNNMDILKKSNLIQVAPEVQGPTYKEYFCYSKQCEEVFKIKKIKDHLKNIFNSQSV